MLFSISVFSTPFVNFSLSLYYILLLLSILFVKSLIFILFIKLSVFWKSLIFSFSIFASSLLILIPLVKLLLLYNLFSFLLIFCFFDLVLIIFFFKYLVLLFFDFLYLFINLDSIINVDFCSRPSFFKFIFSYIFLLFRKFSSCEYTPVLLILLTQIFVINLLSNEFNFWFYNFANVKSEV